VHHQCKRCVEATKMRLWFSDERRDQPARTSKGHPRTLAGRWLAREHSGYG